MVTKLPTEGYPVYGITEPYSIPRIFLPTTIDKFDTKTLSTETMRRVTRLNTSLRETLRKLEQFLLPLSHVRQQVVVIRAILMEIYERTYPSLASLSTKYTLFTNRDVQEETLHPDDLHHLGGYIVYDEYFNTIRVPEMSASQLLCQCSATAYEVLGDLPFTMLAREEIEVLFMALYKMFNCFLPDKLTNVPPVPASYVMQEHNNMQAIEYLWDTMATNEAQRENIAMFRWKVGHHLFNMLTFFLTVSTEKAIDAINDADDLLAVKHLDRASTFLRAGIACEWYAANFSSDIYADIVRPSMVMQDVPGGDGFSGDQNAEFNRFKTSKEHLKTVLRDKRGSLAPNVELAVRQFVEMYVQDGEHHVLLASAMAGNSPSIAQDEWLKDLPDGMPIQSAVDFLRNMVLARRAEFSQKQKNDTQPLLVPVEPMELNGDMKIIATADELEGTQLIRREIDGKPFLIGLTDGVYWATTATCTHKEFLISEVLDDNDCLVCTKHGATFETVTGSKIRGPVGTTDLATYEVINDNGVLKIKGL
ncbi:MAG: hypothetical protein Phog2KO_11910 [Phototrophicaceae bacterium]